MSGRPPRTTDGAGADGLLDEAAAWMVRLQAEGATPSVLRELEQWRTRSAAHAEAWGRAEALMGTFETVPKAIGRETFRGLARPGRRGAVRTLGIAAAVASVGWLGWRDPSIGPWMSSWTADLRTATGERKSLTLSDGSHLVLDTASAVDVLYTHAERRLHLRHGEILVTTSHGDPPLGMERPFVVQTRQGTVRALGTRFSVRTEEGGTRVNVFEGAVRVQRLDAEPSLVLRAGGQVLFSETAIGEPGVASTAATRWSEHMLVVSDMRLAELVAELSRYRPGVLRCHPDVANLRVSGAFSLGDTENSLQLLQKTLPVRVFRLSRYWVVVEPR